MSFELRSGDGEFTGLSRAQQVDDLIAQGIQEAYPYQSDGTLPSLEAFSNLHPRDALELTMQAIKTVCPPPDVAVDRRSGVQREAVIHDLSQLQPGIVPYSERYPFAG